jgi:flagellar motor switch protein FliG
LIILKIKRKKMSGDIVTNDELIYSNMLEIQALIRILTRIGITTEDEIMQEIEKIRDEVNDKLRKLGKEN